MVACNVALPKAIRPGDLHQVSSVDEGKLFLNHVKVGQLAGTATARGAMSKTDLSGVPHADTRLT